jgi:hypothetical protein
VPSGGYDDEPGRHKLRMTAKCLAAYTMHSMSLVCAGALFSYASIGGPDDVAGVWAGFVAADLSPCYAATCNLLDPYVMGPLRRR